LLPINQDSWKRLPSNAAQVSYGSQGVSGCQAESEEHTEDAKSFISRGSASCSRSDGQARVQREVLCRAADPNELACGCKYLEALGNIGTKTVVRATPYGYPLLLVGPSNTINANRDRKGTHCDAI
jgi:hypothetical protein